MILAADSGPWAQVRTGSVTAATPASVTVDIGGTPINAAFNRDQPPQTGDFVAVIRQDSIWLVLYAMSGVGSNDIANPSFESGLDGWAQYDITNISSFVAVGPTDTAPDGQYYFQAATTAATADSFLYSEPIGVTAGDQLSVSAYVWGDYDIDAAETATASLLALWFANETDLYPTTSSANTVITTLANVPAPPPISTLSGTVTAPVSGYMRIALESVVTATGSLSWDLVTARRI
ncbi:MULTISPECIES: hypothetical protein [unclassified Streptomyces]|uniref:hypothetical protein n=1 Tax=unclassified Streptomyces TaxID=2593676 RepID=UPI00081D4E63|nr:MULTISPECIES: hypothetical protein [unclassified Streptomyces]MYZ35473.1 hypothetical protein [Streptomyces sp. SID4917]SCF75758.1 hypothetical protein GA0115259_102126 [Streptomyces sp. MnatMP-M17]